MTVDTPDPNAAAQRFQRLEDPVGDFPFYDGWPVALSGGQWLFVMVAVVAGFAVLTAPIPWPAGALGVLLPAVLFPALPLAALMWVAPGHWRSLFGPLSGRSLRLMLGYALLNIAISISVGTVVSLLATVTPNAAAAQLGDMDAAARMLFFAKTLPQLLGEELVTLLPFLALMHLFVKHGGAGRRTAMVGAWLLSSLAFGLIHLPTYDWNLVQCLVIIGSARMVLTLPWILTKNIWVSTGAHIINDWLLFGGVLLGASLAGTG